MCTISIIVPVYKVEKYLPKCVDSILNQTFEMIELILVDDGSPDCSGEICDQYAEKDKRVKVIHKANGGVSTARNAGLEIATGQYIGFIDSDDYIETDMFELLYTNLKKEKADISACGMFDLYVGREPRILKPQYFVLNAEQALKAFIEGNINNATVTNKLFKKELFEEVRFPENQITEDAFAIFDVTRLAKKVVIDTQQKYYYYHREGSITTSSYTSQDLDTIKTYEANLAKTKEYFPDLYDTMFVKYCWANFVVLDKIILSDVQGPTPRKEMVRLLRANFMKIIKSPMLSKGRKVSMCFLMIHYELYKLFVKGHNKYIQKKNT